MFDRFMDLVEENKRRDQERYLERKRRRAQVLKWGYCCWCSSLAAHDQGQDDNHNRRLRSSKDGIPYKEFHSFAYFTTILIGLQPRRQR